MHVGIWCSSDFLWGVWWRQADRLADEAPESEEQAHQGAVQNTQNRALQQVHLSPVSLALLWCVPEIPDVSVSHLHHRATSSAPGKVSLWMKFGFIMRSFRWYMLHCIFVLKLLPLEWNFGSICPSVTRFIYGKTCNSSHIFTLKRYTFHIWHTYFFYEIISNAIWSLTLWLWPWPLWIHNTIISTSYLPF